MVQRAEAFQTPHPPQPSTAVEAAAASAPRLVAISRGPEIIVAALDQVRYFQAEGKYTRVLLAREEGMLNLGITAVQAQLPPGLFVKVHRSVVVNLALVQRVRRDELGHMYLCLDSRNERVRVARTCEAYFRTGIF
ncbi:hypothetical protein GT347_12400 [Xylophilus rhododendri]|uniref:HTH LytTR-type domain-containing protein n=1 Tax=Xylophilus rhododendri TaxID=2697032 RepID=A0A857J6R3_9BURK|nr:LytTR family DNA-binding domain-containing protein [Xylophilus rhododendri]QHI98721.1 hypothetical protein GT347_12400 [Xylophilus rhododendri]